MKRFSIVLAFLLVVAACGFAAWFALRDVPPADDGRSPVAATREAGEAVDDASGEAADGSGGRRRVARVDDEGRPVVAGDRVAGHVVYEGVGVAGASVEAYAAPGGDFDARREQARRIFGDLFSDAELKQMERRFAGLRPQGDVRVTEPSAATGDSGGGATISIGIGANGDDGGGVDLSSIDLESDRVQEAMGAGMEMVGRMLSDPTLIEKAMELGRIEAAGFETDGDWPRVGSARTEADGSFLIEGLPEGRVELRVRASGYVRAKRTVDVGTGGVEVPLSKGAALEGTVTSAGTPVGGATVRTKTRTLETDGAGRFRLEGAVTPKESVLVTARGFVAAGRSVELTVDGPNLPVAIELEPAAIVRGVVVGSDGTPLAGASVRVTKGGVGFNPMMFMQLAQGGGVTAPAPSTLTDANGVFELDGIPGGTVKLMAEHRGYLAFTTESLAVRAGEVLDGVEITLLRESVVSGIVRGPDGATVEGAVVKVALDTTEGLGSMVAGMFGGAWTSATTEADGTYRVGGLTGGSRTVRVEARGFLHEEEAVQVPDEGSAALDFELRPGYRLEGLVLTPNGEPAAGARVEVRWASSANANPLAAMTGMVRGADASGTTDDAGRFALDGLQEGPWSLTAKAEGHLDATADDVPQGATDVVLQLRAAAAIRGIVRDVDGQPVAGAWVHRKGGRRAGGGNPWLAMLSGDPRVLTAADGTFELPELEAGRYTLYARRQGYADSESVKLQVAAGESLAEIELVLRPGESLVGRVIEKGSGNAVPGAIVYVALGSGPMAGMNPQDFVDGDPSAPPGSISTQSGEDGRFTLEGLTPGKVTVEVRTKDHAPASLSRIDVPGGEVIVEVGRGGRVEGVVLDAAGNPVSGTQVILSGGAMGFGRQRVATSDANGFYEMDRVVPGAYQIMKMDSASAFGVGGMGTVAVREGETTRHDFKPDATGAIVSGVVEREAKGVEGAMVILTGGSVGMRMTTSDAKGAFSFDGLPPGKYTVSVQTDILGGGTTSESVTLEERQVLSDLRLRLSSLALEGRVVDAETGKGIGFAQVILFDPTVGTLSSLEEIVSHQRGQAITDAKGQFKISGLADGTFSLRVSAAGYAEETREGVKPGANLSIRLDPGAAFEVTVVGPDGEPVVGATVVAVDASGRETMAFGMGGLEAITNAQGVATLRLAPGRYAIIAESAGLPSGSVDVDAGRGAAVVRLEQGGGIEIVVRKAGQPVAGAQVALLDEAGNPIVKRVSMGNFLGSGATTDAAGRALREGLPPGRVTVVVTPPEGGTPVRKTVTVPRAGTETVEIELP